MTGFNSLIVSLCNLFFSGQFGVSRVNIQFFFFFFSSLFMSSNTEEELDKGNWYEIKDFLNFNPENQPIMCLTINFFFFFFFFF